MQINIKYGYDSPIWSLLDPEVVPVLSLEGHPKSHFCSETIL